MKRLGSERRKLTRLHTCEIRRDRVRENEKKVERKKEEIEIKREIEK